MKLTINVLHRSLEAALVPVWEYVARQNPILWSDIHVPQISL